MNPIEDRAIKTAEAPGLRLTLNAEWRHPAGIVPAGTSGTVVRKFQGYQLMTDPCPDCGAQQRLDRIPASMLDPADAGANDTGETSQSERQPRAAAQDHHVDAETYAALNTATVTGTRVSLVESHETRELRLAVGTTGTVCGKYRGYEVDFDPCRRCRLAPRVGGIPHHKVRFAKI